MKHWTGIRTTKELKAFQIAFRTLSDDEKQIITDEMLKCIDDYRKEVRIIDSTSREAPLLRKRNGRARKPYRVANETA